MKIVDITEGRKPTREELQKEAEAWGFNSFEEYCKYVKEQYDLYEKEQYDLFENEVYYKSQD